MSTANCTSSAAISDREILPLKGGSYALRIAGRAGRPIVIYGFRTPGEAEAWYNRMEARRAE